jgi:hypothetical protein
MRPSPATAVCDPGPSWVKTRQGKRQVASAPPLLAARNAKLALPARPLIRQTSEGSLWLCALVSGDPRYWR